MKKLSTILLLMACYMSSFSQAKNNLEFGVSGGFNLAYAQNGIGSTEPHKGYNFNAFADYYLSNRVSIKVRLGYDQKGWDSGVITNLNNGKSFETNYHLDYLTIPVLFNYHFGKKRNWYLNVGPYAGILLSAKDSEFDMDLKDYVHNTEFGLDLGLGVKFPIADNVKLLLEIDGQSGFTDVFKADTDGSKVINARTSFNVGFAFSLNNYNRN